MYSVLPYYLAKILSDIPGFIIVPMAFTAITYFSIGLTRDTAQFFQFCLTSIMNTITGVSLGYMMSAIFTNAATALALAPIIAMPLMLVGGFFQNQDERPIYIEVFSYVSPIQYAFNNHAKLEFENSEYPVAKMMAEFLDI